ncbi:type VI secretion system membrane subunit TssM [Thioalkalivibrio sp. ALgr3]|uniref:type VI secretion system membrane subunit TssM n=1 Tax=Thioalkalivibrio sp. ALgr3 TaxID=1239292 RepID=UPI00035CBA02|nr:type VI secretion system membrane subunit TssM [Thioalkalivibrio sp. ALgr3]
MWNHARKGISRFARSIFKPSAIGGAGKAAGQGGGSGKLWFWLLVAMLAAVLAVIWIWGPAWQVGDSHPLAPWPNRLAVILAVVATVLVIWGVRLAARLKAVDEERRQADQPDPVALAVEHQTQGLARWLKQLRGHLGRRRRAMYSLPWYMVLGPDDSGKTSLINRSGLRFALTRTVLQPEEDEGSGRRVDWWVSDQAVLVEPGEGLLEHDSGRDENAMDAVSQGLWSNLVDWIRVQRPRRPLDGVLLVLDLSWLASANPSKRRQQAEMVRGRLQDLTTRYRSRVPVYVVLTKMDGLFGFDEFFRHYGRDARSEPLGFSFEPGVADQPDHWEQAFAKEYEGMVQRIDRRLLNWLAESRDRSEREAVFRFSRQLAGLGEVLRETLQEALSARRYATEPQVRGVYFTSVYQQGVPVDPFAETASARYRMKGEARPAYRAARSVAYFSEQLLQRVVFPEAGLVGETADAVAKRRTVHRATIALCLGGGLALVLGWGHFYQKNALALQAVEAKAHGLMDVQPSVMQRDDPTGQSMVDLLDRMRDATAVFGDYRQRWPAVADMGLYQGYTVGRMVDQAYLDMLQYHFLPAVMIGIADEMNTAAPGSNEQLTRLRILRMISDASGRQPERVHAYMADRWQRQFPNQGELQRRLLAHMDYAMAHTDLLSEWSQGNPRAQAAMEPVEGSIREAQQVLARQPLDERVYSLLRKQGEARGDGALRLDRRVGPGWSTVFRARDGDVSSIRLPGLLTRQGFEEVFLEDIEEATELALVDLWVLGRRDDIAFSDRDEERLRDALRERYVADYHVTWRQALDNIRLVDFEHVSHAVVVMDALLGASRPLDRLLLEAGRHTDLYPRLPVDDEAAREALKTSPRYQLAGEVARHFEALHAVGRADEDDPSDLESAMAAVAELRDHLRAIEQSSEPGRTAFRHARDRLLLSSGDPVEAVERLAGDLPAPVDRFLDDLAQQSWQLITAEAIRYLERQWLDEVVAPFESGLAGRYPLDPEADREAALEDFEAFFAEGGVIDGFFQDKLQPFIDEGPELLEDADGASLLNPAVLRSVEQAQWIREAYFGRDGLLDVEFTVEPVTLSSDKRRSILNVDGQLLEYRHGAPEGVRMIWPNNLRDTNESRITLVPGQVNRSPRSVSFRGAWAWFRLVDHAEIVSAGERELKLRFGVDGGHMTYELTAKGSRNPFTRPLTRNYDLPTALYHDGGSRNAETR